MGRQLPVVATINTQFMTRLFSAEQIADKIMDALSTSITKLPAFSDPQTNALRNAFKTLFTAIHEPLLDKLAKINGMRPVTRIGKVRIDIRGKKKKLLLLNSSTTYGSNTSLELEVPIALILNLYLDDLCDHFGVPNTKKGQNSINFHLIRPSNAQVRLYLKSLSQSNLLARSQRCSSKIGPVLQFSINPNFVHEQVDK